MRPLKTIIATAVIVFALTTVATAGVGQFTKTPSAKATGKTPVQYTVTLSAKQLAQLMNSQGKAATTRTVHHARHAHRRHQATHRQSNNGGSQRSYSGSTSGRTSGRSYSGSGSHSSYRCYSHSGGNRWGGGSGGSHSGGGGCW